MKYTLMDGAHKPGPEFVVTLMAMISEGTTYRVFNSNNKEIPVVARDVHGKVTITIHPQFRAIVPTGIKIMDAEGFIAQVFTDKDVAAERGFGVNGGTEMYALTEHEQEIFVTVVNNSNAVVQLRDGDIIAKAIFNKYRKSNQLEFVVDIDTLTQS